eukprot:TRINITY_DN1234_c0_g1_i4.p1 TRINITY_DN1234_c0_g1~~TRINITY_DN1234_c0_g1_i4.p1  ORF type:complete len:256 (-),score=32.66 TRINITY_DN1234_c0_g1_i4:319-1086(-)
MLSAWLRIRYPNVCSMALASSAPIKMANGYLKFVGSPPYYETVTNTLKHYGEQCPDITRRAFSEILELSSRGEEGFKLISKLFSLCKPLTTADMEQFILWIQTSFGTLAQLNYPYPSNFLAPLPAYPAKVACDILMNSSSPVHAIIEISNLLYNGTQAPISCFDIYSEFTGCANKVGCLSGFDGMAWDFQQCSGINILANTNNKTDMFPPKKWIFGDIEAHCKSTWGVTPDPEWMKIFTGGEPLLVFSLPFFLVQ